MKFFIMPLSVIFSYYPKMIDLMENVVTASSTKLAIALPFAVFPGL
jgi:hypothetical protein